MNEKATTCLFAGSEPRYMTWYRHIGNQRTYDLFEFCDDAIEEALSRGYDTFMTGAVKGVDIYAAELIANRKYYERTHTMRLIAVIPCFTQANGWTELQRIEHKDLLRDCDEKITMRLKNTKGLQEECTRYMIERSSLLITAFADGDEKSERTACEARSCGLDVVKLNLTTFEIEKHMRSNTKVG